MPAESPTGKKLGDSDTVIAECEALEGELIELQVAYEQFFLGAERRPPTRKHEAFKSKLLRLKSTVVRQTTAKFRVNNLAQKVSTFERLWDRTLKEMEAGVYKRDIYRARRHQKEREKQPPASQSAELEAEELDLSDLEDEPTEGDTMADALSRAAANQPKPGMQPMKAPAAVAAKPVAAPLAKPAAPVAAAPAAKPSAPGAPGVLSEQKIRAIYEAYVSAKKRCGEDTSALSLSSVADTLRKQVPTLMKQHNAKSVDFKVVIKDGKAVLRALPKE